MASARVNLPPGLSQLLRDDMERVIVQANLGLENTQIAKMYLLDGITHMDIAVEMGYDRSTVTKRMHKIVCRSEQTAHILGII